MLKSNSNVVLYSSVWREGILRVRKELQGECVYQKASTAKQCGLVERKDSKDSARRHKEQLVVRPKLQFVVV